MHNLGFSVVVFLVFILLYEVLGAGRAQLGSRWGQAAKHRSFFFPFLRDE